MVYAFLIHSLEDGFATHALNDNTSVLAVFYTEEGNDDKRRGRIVAICDEAHRQCVAQLQLKQKTKVDASYARCFAGLFGFAVQ